MSRRKIAAVLAGLVAGLGLIGSAQAQVRTLARSEDPVVIPGRRIPSLAGTSLDKLALMAWQSSQWVPAPFQIDERRPDGEYAFTQGPQAGPDPVPGFDENDELVFMAGDAGDRALDGALPAGAMAAAEIGLSDPRTRGQAWVYLVSFAGPGPRSDVDYVRFALDPGKKRWSMVTRGFVMEGNEDYTFPDFLAKNLSGHLDGKRIGPDVLDRIKIRGQIIGPLDLSVDLCLDKITKARTTAWSDGPIRVLQASDSYFDLGLIELHGKVRAVITYYWNHVIWPMYMEVPDVGFLVKKVNMAAYMDFTPAAYGSHVFYDVAPYNDEAVLDGKLSPAESRINDDQPTAWVAGFGPAGAMMCRILFPREWSRVSILPYFLDDGTLLDLPEDNPGVSAPGFKFVGFEDLGAFHGTYYQYFYFKPELTPEGVNELLSILDSPLETSVQEVRPPG